MINVQERKDNPRILMNQVCQSSATINVSWEAWLTIPSSISVLRRRDWFFWLKSQQAISQGTFLHLVQLAAKQWKWDHFWSEIPKMATKCINSTVWNWAVNSLVQQKILAKSQIIVRCINSTIAGKPPHAVN